MKVKIFFVDLVADKIDKDVVEIPCPSLEMARREWERNLNRRRRKVYHGAVLVTSRNHPK